MSLPGYHMPHAPWGPLRRPGKGVEDDVRMKDTLSGCRAYVSADVATAGLEPLVHQLALRCDHLHAGIDRFGRRVEKSGDMAARNNRGIPRARRMGIAGTVRHCIL